MQAKWIFLLTQLDPWIMEIIINKNSAFNVQTTVAEDIC